MKGYKYKDKIFRRKYKYKMKKLTKTFMKNLYKYLLPALFPKRSKIQRKHKLIKKNKNHFKIQDEI